MRVEYAGFLYEVTGNPPIATPLPGQHTAAGKDKHRRAAVEEAKDQGYELDVME